MSAVLTLSASLDRIRESVGRGGGVGVEGVGWRWRVWGGHM